MEALKWIRLQWDRVAAWVCVAGGAVALIVGWVGVSTTAFPAEQIPYVISGGIGGIFFLGLAAILWLSADLRDEWTKLDRIEDVLRGPAAPVHATSSAPSSEDPGSAANELGPADGGQSRPYRRDADASHHDRQIAVESSS